MQPQATASTAVWRTLLLAFCFLCLVINAVSLFSLNVEASSALGYQAARVDDPAFVSVSSVDPGGAAEASGLRAGDLIHLRELSPGDRYRLLTGVYPHERIDFTVTRGDKQVAIHYRSGDAPAWRWDTILWGAASFWMIGFAMLLAWRRADSMEARTLCVLIGLNPLSSGLLVGSWIGYSPFADMITAIIGYALTWLGVALLATYAQLFGRPLNPARRVLTAFAYLSAATCVIYEAARLVQLWTGAAPWVAQTMGPDWNLLAWGAVPLILALLCALVAIPAAHPMERGRIAWTTATLSLFYIAQAFAFAVPLLFRGVGRGETLIIAYSLINVGAFLAPLGMTYALLNRRLLDMSFALNRVAIFSVVSLVIVGAFVLVEWALGIWLGSASQTTNLLVSAALALALGLSIHFVHGRVEHVLDRVFFRKRHEDEQAIRAFAREAAYMTDPQALVARTASVLEKHGDASFVRVALEHAGAYGGVNENDPAIVALRTWHRSLDLHDMDTQLVGEYAYPMIAGGSLIGALVLGPKHSHEAYAPDESRAIEELAHGVAGALHVLSQKQSAADNRVVAELEEMRASIAAGFAKITERLDNGVRQ